jgi:hypothetical protein
MLFERQGWAKSTSKNVAKAYLPRAFFNIQAGGGNAPPVPPCAHPTKSHFAPQEKSLFPKIIQTNQRRLTNT